MLMCTHVTRGIQVNNSFGKKLSMAVKKAHKMKLEMGIKIK